MDRGGNMVYDKMTQSERNEKWAKGEDGFEQMDNQDRNWNLTYYINTKMSKARVSAM